jgi:hypothetical protein
MELCDRSQHFAEKREAIDKLTEELKELTHTTDKEAMSKAIVKLHLLLCTVNPRIQYYEYIDQQEERTAEHKAKKELYTWETSILIRVLASDDDLNRQSTNLLLKRIAFTYHESE